MTPDLASIVTRLITGEVGLPPYFQAIIADAKIGEEHLEARVTADLQASQIQRLTEALSNFVPVGQPTIGFTSGTWIATVIRWPIPMIRSSASSRDRSRSASG